MINSLSLINIRFKKLIINLINLLKTQILLKKIIMYTVFVRNWWKNNPSWPNGLEPDPSARKTKLATFETQEECIEYCKEYNRTHKSGRLSRKAEFTQYW